MIFQKHNLERHDIILKYEEIMQLFQNMKSCREQLNKLTLGVKKYIVSYICKFLTIITFCRIVYLFRYLYLLLFLINTFIILFF
jgi:hypothetical protein